MGQARRGQRRSADSRDEEEGEQAAVDTVAVTPQLRHLYMDFRRSQAELLQMLERLRGRHGRSFFPGVPSQQLLEEFVDRFFPEDFPGEYFICNISHTRSPYFLIRPSRLTPRMLEVLPRGLTLAIKGHLFDDRRFPDRPVVWVRQIIDLADAPARPFERTVRVRCYHSERNIYPDSARSDCCLTTAFVEQLPRIHDETSQRLEHWLEYVEFRQKMAWASQAGLRYIRAEIGERGGRQIYGGDQRKRRI